MSETVAPIENPALALLYAKSDRIEEIEDRVKTIDNAIAWMEEQITAFLVGKST